MRTANFPAKKRYLTGWHLGMLAIAIALLVLFCPGRSAAAELFPSSDVLVPFFEVDLSDPDLGLTTLFAICNGSTRPVDVSMTVRTNWGISLLTIHLTLQADEARSFSLRDWLVRGDLPDRDLTLEELAHVQAALSGKPSPRDNLYYGSEIEPDLAVGYIVIRTLGADRPDVLWGDYFEVEARRGFFQAETLVDIDPSHAPTTCKRHGVRFIQAGMLSDGTQLLIWTDRQWSPSPVPLPLEDMKVTTNFEVYDEPGRHVEDRSRGLLPVEMLRVKDLNLTPRFGWLDIVTEEASFITEHFHTTSDPSSALHAYCLPAKVPGEDEVPGPLIEIEKYVNGADADLPPGPAIPVGSNVTWEYQVRNIGTQPLTGVVVSDDSGAAVTCPLTALEPNEEMTCALGGIAKACQQRNLGSVLAYAPDFSEVTDEDWAHYFGQHHASLGLEKRVNGQDADGSDADEGPWPHIPVGDAIHWTYIVTNTGDVELAAVAITDDQGLVVSCPKAILQAGESMTCTATSLAELGLHRNVATAKGTPPCGNDVFQTDPATYTGWIPEPRIDLEKRVNEQDADLPPGPTVELGAPVAWSFLVTNIGDVPLTNVAVTDVPLGTVTCPKAELAVGESMTCTVQGSALACQVGNVATAVGTAPGGAVVTDTDPAHYFGQHHAAVALEKYVEGQDADSTPGPELRTGDTVHWTFVVTNTGDVTLTGIAVTDDRGAAVTCPKSTLAPAESMTCTASGAAVSGQYRNIGTVVATPPCGAAASASDPAHYYGRSPAIALQKLTNGQDADTPTGPQLAVGSAVLWTYVVTNTGDTPLTAVAVTDDKGVTVTCPKTVLAAGESMTCTATGTAVAGQYANVGTATGTPPIGPNVTATDPSHYFGFRPLVSIEKRVNGQDADECPGPQILVGTTLSWTYLVTNLGDVTLTNVGVTDDQGIAVSCPKTALEPGESMTCTATSTATVGQHRNVATVTGTPASGSAVTATDPVCYTGLAASIDIEKFVNGFDADSAPGPSFLVGTALTWTYVVTNTGEVTLSTVGVTDSDGVTVSCPKTTLAPGEAMTCTANGTAIAGQQANIGRATGTPAGGSEIWAEDPAHYYGEMLGNQGCTPGYWKNHTGSWPPTGYSTTQDVDTVFANVNTYYPGLGNASLLEALAFGGGPGGEGAAEILLRAAVAAVLNASHPDVAYPRTPASVISDVNNALLQSRDSMLALAAQLDADNNLGCPLH